MIMLRLCLLSALVALPSFAAAEPVCPGDPRCQIPPTGSGKVRFVDVFQNGSRVGSIGVTSETMPANKYPPKTAYWTWFPKATTGNFEIRIGVGQTFSETDAKVASRVQGATVTSNPRFGTKLVTFGPGLQPKRVWRINESGKHIGYMALIGNKIHWFSFAKRRYLPGTTLKFTVTPTPQAGQGYHAVDVPR